MSQIGRWWFVVVLVAVAVATVAVAAVAPARAQERPLSDFYGEYVGRSVAGTFAVPGEVAEVQPRHLNVSIQPYEQGFSVAWMTITTRASGKTKAKSYLVNFAPSDRPGIYVAAMRLDTAGKPAPLDPVTGEPYMWASVEGNTLSVHALVVTEDGGWEVMDYNRTLTEEGMDLVFQRHREGELVKEITGILHRVGD